MSKISPPSTLLLPLALPCIMTPRVGSPFFFFLILYFSFRKTPKKKPFKSFF
jgi:hypothetical protein